MERERSSCYHSLPRSAQCKNEEEKSKWRRRDLTTHLDIHMLHSTNSEKGTVAEKEI